MSELVMSARDQQKSQHTTFRDGDMKKRYVYCPDCDCTRMRLLGESNETFGSPPTAVERYYGCPGCGLQRAYDIRRNAFLARKITGIAVPLSARPIASRGSS